MLEVVGVALVVAGTLGDSELEDDVVDWPCLTHGCHRNAPTAMRPSSAATAPVSASEREGRGDCAVAVDSSFGTGASCVGADGE